MADAPAEPALLAPLLVATAAGDEDAFARLYALTSPKLFAVVVRLLQRRDWAEEALQDVYVRIWQKAESYSVERGSPMTWLATIARYRALDLLRGKNLEINESMLDEGQMESLMTTAAADSPERLAIERTELDRLDDCLKQLPEEQRRIVMLSYYAGFTHSELAKKMSTPLGTVKSWTRRGLLHLRECLGAA